MLVYDLRARLGAAVTVNPDGSFTLRSDGLPRHCRRCGGVRRAGDTFTYRATDGCCLERGDRHDHVSGVKRRAGGDGRRLRARRKTRPDGGHRRACWPTIPTWMPGTSISAGQRFDAVRRWAPPSRSMPRQLGVRPDRRAALQGLKRAIRSIDTFTYTIRDLAGATQHGDRVGPVSGINDAPCGGQRRYATNEDSAAHQRAGRTRWRPDPEGEPLQVVYDATSARAGATVTVNPTAASPTIRPLPRSAGLGGRCGRRTTRSRTLSDGALVSNTGHGDDPRSPAVNDGPVANE